MTDEDDERDEDRSVCGHRITGPTGIHWICTRPPHDDPELDPVLRGTYAESERHWYVRARVPL